MSVITGNATVCSTAYQDKPHQRSAFLSGPTDGFPYHRSCIVESVYMVWRHFLCFLQADNTYVLALDGDVDFRPEAVRILVDRMKKNPKVGATCGRIHPIGSG